MRNYQNSIYDKLIQTTALVVGLGASAIAYHNNNSNNALRHSENDNSRHQKNNIEAILVKDEQIVAPTNYVLIPRK